jgi:hypothetical protein
VKESQRAKLLKFNDKMNQFNLAVENGSWREIAIDRDSEGEQVQQSHVVAQPDVVQEESFVDMNCDDGGGFDEIDHAYESDEADGDASAEDVGSETEGERDNEIEAQQSNELNELIIESESRISLQECTLPEDLALWLLDPVERYPEGQVEQKFVGDFCVELLLNMLENKYAMQNIRQDFNIISRYFSNAPSYNKVEALLRKIGSPFHTFYTCVNHHPVTSNRGSACIEPSCRKDMSIPIKQLKIMDVLRRAMQDTTFAQGVRYGPSLPRQGSDQMLSSVWQSPAIERLRLEKGLDMEMTDEYIPIVIELFTDGFSPFNRSVYSIWCVLMRILNLPPELGKKYRNIYPLMIVDGPKEAESIDQYLGMIVKDIEDICSGEGETLYDAARKSHIRTKVFLLCSAQDTRALRLVAKHDETPSQWPCHMCKIFGESFKIGKGQGMQRIAYKASSMPEPTESDKMNLFLWNSDEVRSSQSWVEEELKKGKVTLDNKAFPGFAQQRKGIRGVCAFSSLPYFDLVNGFLFCAMHGIQNAASRAEGNVVGKFDTETLRKFLNLTGLPKWVMRLAPRDSQSRRDDPNRYSEKNSTQARNFVSFICKPSGLHGDPSRLFRKPNQSKKREEENDSNAAKIKASEYKDFAISGIMCAAMYFGGVDPAVVKAYDGLFYALKKLCSPVINVEEIKELDEQGMYHIMLELESQLPKTEMPFHLHSIYHLPSQVLNYGPLPDLWSFPLESKFKDMKSMAKKKNMPVASMASRLSTEMAVRLIASAMENHRGRDEHELSEVMPTVQEDLVLPSKCRQINLNQDEDLGIVRLIQEYYVSSESMEDILGRQYDWAELQYTCLVAEAYEECGTTQIPHLIKQLALMQFQIFEYDKLILHGVEIEHKSYVERMKVATDNSYLLLRQDQPGRLPTLAQVQAIYRIIIPDRSREMHRGPLDERILLRVTEYTTEDLDPDLKQCGLQDVLLYHTQTPATERLIDVSCIKEQAFLAPDMRTIHGSLGEKPRFESYLVLNKGSLRNVDLSKFFKEKPI